MKKFSTVILALAVTLASYTLQSAEAKASDENTRVSALILPIRFTSQLSEPAPSGWTYGLTPYCVAAASVMVMSAFGVETWSLSDTFALGRTGNKTPDPGIDPTGNSHLFRYFGGEGKIHTYWNRGTALEELAGRLNNGSPVVFYGQAGNHAMVAYGYEADWGGTVTAIYVADPLGFMGRVDAWSFMNLYNWFGSPFSAAGSDWQGSWTFVSYKDYRP